MERILRVNFGEVYYFAKLIKHNKHGFEIETVFPVEGIKYSDTSSGDYDQVSYFEERVLKAFKEKLIFEIELVRKQTIIKQKLQELEFSLSIFIDEEQPLEKQERIKKIFGETFFRDNFPNFEFTPSMVNYLIEYLDFSKENVLKGKRVSTDSQEVFFSRL